MCFYESTYFAGGHIHLHTYTLELSRSPGPAVVMRARTGRQAIWNFLEEMYGAISTITRPELYEEQANNILHTTDHLVHY